MSSLLRTVLVRGQQSVNVIRIPSRSIVQSLRCNEKAAVIPPIKDAVPIIEPTHSTAHIIGGRKHSPNNLEKRFLVWSGKYKSVAEVPASVSQETMEKSRNKARIKVANIMILATILSCIAVVISGKRAAKRGESVQQMNLDWHRQIKEEANADKIVAK